MRNEIFLAFPAMQAALKSREAYIRLAKEYHPDTHPDDPVAERRFKRITKAYNELRSSFRVLGGARTYRAPKYWASYRQVLASASFVFCAGTFGVLPFFEERRAVCARS